MQCPTCGTVFEARFCFMCGWDSTRAASSGPSFPPSSRAEGPVSAPAGPQPSPPVPPPPMPGIPFPEYRCLNCGAKYRGWSCPSCGTPAGYAPPVAGLRAIGSVFWSIAAVAFFLLLVVNLVAFAYASSLIVQGAIAGGPRPIDLYLLLPFPVGASIDAEPTIFLAYFALIASGIIGAYAWFTFRDTKTTADAFLRPLVDLRSRLESRSGWISTGQVFLAALFFQVIYLVMLELAGSTPAPPTGGPVPAWYPYFALANASVYEEVVTRWIFIGVPLFLAGAALKGAVPSAQAVPVWRHLFGGTVNRNSHPTLIAVAVAFVGISSVIFGLGHVPAWGWWKFLPAMVAGLGMGYLFVRRGLLAAILFHFANDYLAATALLTQDSLGAQVLLAVFLLVLVALGSFFFVWYFVYLAGLANHWAVKWGLRQPAPAAVGGGASPPPPPGFASPSYPPAPPAYAPPGYAPPGFGPPGVPWFGGSFATFTCPRCGGREARYEAGRFTCLRCGHAGP